MAMEAEVAQEVPEGFKLTEIGLLPGEWEVAPFQQCILRRPAKVGKVKQQQYKATGRFPIIDQGQQFIAGYWDSEEDVYRGDLPTIVFGDHTRILKYVDFPFFCGADGTKVLLPNKAQFDPRFLFFALLTLDIPSRGYNRHYRLLREKSLPRPPLDEQRAIARVLSTIQRAVEATERVIAAARQFKRSLMRHLFTYGPVPIAEAERVPLKETQIGPVPEQWQVVRLGQVCSLSTGTTPSTNQPRYWGGDIPFIKTSEIANSVLDSAHHHVTQEAAKDYNLRIHPPGTVFLAMYGQGKTRGQVGLLRVAATTSQNTAAILPREQVMPEYLWLYLMGQYESLRAAGALGQISHLTLGHVKDVKMPLPTADEQRLITWALLAAQQKAEAEEKRRAALKELFRTMLHLLMTGQVRVKDLELGNGPAT
jgi:type I restriction enzyme S subunit